GMTETGGPGLGIDCPARAGIHVWEDHYYVEVVDPRTGRVVADGAEGELVVSTLTREGLPLVRYRTHDLTRVVSRARCECGRTALRLDRLRGRTDDMVIYKGVNFYPRQVETVLLAHAGVSHEYQIVLDAEGGGERMTVMVETDPGCDPGVAARMKRDLHDALVARLPVDVLATNQRPRSYAALGIDEPTLRAVRRDLIWLGISGFGPDHDEPAYDPVLQARAGFVALTGEPEGAPTPFGAPM